MDRSCCSLTLPIFSKNKKGKRSLSALPTGAIAESFKEYINNEIPARFIDTSELRFVPRREVFRFFQDEIANVTEEQIEERMAAQGDPLATYQPRRENILRQIIQEVVKYDVLSHRRNDVNEPSFQDIIAAKRSMQRCKKLVEFCKMSRKLGRKLAWIDRCCIDETDTTELSEAVNAMYKWYANSYLCIVYLAESTSFEDWVQESWFERRWTLQELLAPKRLKFYDKNWQPLNPSGIEDDRQLDDIVTHLEKITGIRRTVLTADNSQGVHGHTFWEIMSWASKRRTTRIEDNAYSLVGFFSICLPIAYGDKYRAFSGFVEAVAKKNPSWDVFAWCGEPSSEHFALPLSPSSYPTFEGDMGKDRVGVRDFTITRNGLFLKSLPLVLMEVCTVVNPVEPRQPFFVSLKSRLKNEGSLGKYGNLVVECGATRLKTIREARQLSACILNHHGTKSREKGKLVVGKEYICFLLYSISEESEETERMTWMKIATNNLLRMACVGAPGAVIHEQGIAGPSAFDLSLTITHIQPPIASS